MVPVTRASLLIVVMVAGIACGGPYNELEKNFPPKIDLQPKLIAARTIVLTGKKHTGAENLRGIANIGLAPDFVEIGVDKGFAFLYSKIQIPTDVITGCSKTCFGPGKWDADLLLNDVGIQISVENSQEVLDWCWDNSLPMVSHSARSAWMYEGKQLPARAAYVRVSKHEYTSQARSACLGY